MPSNFDETSVKILDTTANPAPLGLLAFGLTTTLLNLHNAGLSVNQYFVQSPTI